MDFLRMEGEFNFLLLLPEEIRRRERDYWYRGASQEVKDYLFGNRIDFEQQTGIAFTSRDPKTELFGKLRAHLQPVLDLSYELAAGPDGTASELHRLSQLKGRALSWLPQISFLSITARRGGKEQVLDTYSLLETSATATSRNPSPNRNGGCPTRIPSPSPAALSAPTRTPFSRSSGTGWLRSFQRSRPWPASRTTDI
jgi:hypothetical protein